MVVVGEESSTARVAAAPKFKAAFSAYLRREKHVTQH